NPGVIHALWTLNCLGALDGKDEKATTAVIAALKHKSSGVRRNAVQVLPHDQKSVRAILESGALHDEDAQVRLMALLSLAEMPASSEAGRAIAEMLADDSTTRERWLMDAATSAAAAHDLPFLKSVLTREQIPA